MPPLRKIWIFAVLLGDVFERLARLSSFRRLSCAFLRAESSLPFLWNDDKNVSDRVFVNLIFRRRPFLAT